MRRYLTFPILIVLAVTALLIFWLVRLNAPAALPPEQVQSGTGGLNVSASGSQIFTNVDSSGLQQAAPPTKSATNSELNPQQAKTNYCAAGETPVADGCMVQAE